MTTVATRQATGAPCPSAARAARLASTAGGRSSARCPTSAVSAPMGDRNILLLGRRGAVVEEVRRELAIPGVELFGGTGIEDLRSAFAGAEIDHVIIGAGIDLEARLELVAEVFRLSDTTTVHMKDRATGLEGFLPFVRALLSGLGGYPTARADGSPAHRLGALIGRWRTRGSTVEGPTGPAAEIDAVDTYEWLPGGHAVLHRVDARVGGETVEGAEIIGYDPALEAYRT